MKRFNLHDMYEAGRTLGRIAEIVGTDAALSKAYDLWMARYWLNSLLAPGSVLLNSARRAAQPVVEAITDIVPMDWNDVIQIPADRAIGFGAANRLSTVISDFQTVLRIEMPDVAAFVVAQRGIYRTDDLISDAQKHITARHVGLLPPQALSDIKDAGKCLAFELGTACAFHLWRAVESTMAFYYQLVTERSFADDKVQRNWGAYIKALEGAGADEKITALLRHIKDEFRNPQTHPEESVQVDEAQRLFPVALSAIEQMLSTGYKTVAERHAKEGRIPPAPTYAYLTGQTLGDIALALAGATMPKLEANEQSGE